MDEKKDDSNDSAPRQPDAQQHGGSKEQQQSPGDKTHPDAQSKPKEQPPPGGYDATPIVPHSPGYTVRITFHRATALPIADAFSLSSDPYIMAELRTDLPHRHKEDPRMRFRTRTIFKNTAPVWNEEWVVDNIPTSGFFIKARIYDEDQGDADDRLGNAHIHVGRIDEHWQGIRDQPYKIKKRSGSKRAYLLRAVAVCMRQAHEMHGNLFVSVEVLGRSASNEGGRAYTVGLQYWCKHYSPLLGRIAGSRVAPNEPELEAGEDTEAREPPDQKNAGSSEPAADVTHGSQAPIPGTQLLKDRQDKKAAKKRSATAYMFEANQMQLKGPVPPELYHRFVEFRPFIRMLFTSKGIRGVIMHSALHHQHAQVYNFSPETKYGVFRQGPCEGMTQRFLDLCHHSDGGRLFTYVLTLDALWRFTETGKEFGIDMLSKHTMHSDASIYIAYSGEFFIRRRQDHDHPHGSGSASGGPAEADASASAMTKPHPKSTASATNSDQNSKPHAETNSHAGASPEHPDYHTTKTSRASDPSHSPSAYELVIDNDSGTYRPNAALLPLLHSFLSSNLPGLRIVTLDCQADKELMDRLKDEQRERKRQANARANGGRPVVYTQASSSDGSVSSSDIDRLERRESDAMLEERRRREAGTGTGEGRSGERDQ